MALSARNKTLDVFLVPFPHRARALRTHEHERGPWSAVREWRVDRKGQGPRRPRARRTASQASRGYGYPAAGTLHKVAWGSVKRRPRVGRAADAEPCRHACPRERWGSSARAERLRGVRAPASVFVHCLLSGVHAGKRKKENTLALACA